MKFLPVTLFLCLASTASTFAGDDSVNLANGYAQAFQASGRTGVCVVYQGSGPIEFIKDVSEIKAFSGVLLIKAYGGRRQILDPGRVVKIGDGD